MRCSVFKVLRAGDLIIGTYFGISLVDFTAIFSLLISTEDACDLPLLLSNTALFLF